MPHCFIVYLFVLPFPEAVVIDVATKVPKRMHFRAREVEAVDTQRRPLMRKATLHPSVTKEENHTPSLGEKNNSHQTVDTDLAMMRSSIGTQGVANFLAADVEFALLEEEADTWFSDRTLLSDRILGYGPGGCYSGGGGCKEEAREGWDSHERYECFAHYHMYCSSNCYRSGHNCNSCAGCPSGQYRSGCKGSSAGSCRPNPTPSPTKPTCNGYTCGPGLTDKSGMASITCVGNTCTDTDCCNQVKCNGHDCGPGFRDKSGKNGISCPADQCTNADCCDQVVCSGHDCGPGWTEKSGMAAITCPADQCTNADCCEQVMCSGYGCGPGWINKSGMAAITCPADQCNNTDCCDQVTCSGYECGPGWLDTPGKDGISCPEDQCADTDCCDQVTCNGHTCAQGFKNKSGIKNTICSEDLCTDIECCDKVTCSNYTCSDGWTSKQNKTAETDAEPITCADDPCNDTECCDQDVKAMSDSGANRIVARISVLTMFLALVAFACFGCL